MSRPHIRRHIVAVSTDLLQDASVQLTLVDGRAVFDRDSG
jgi:hypothetical protein